MCSRYFSVFLSVFLALPFTVRSQDIWSGTFEPDPAPFDCIDSVKRERLEATLLAEAQRLLGEGYLSEPLMARTSTIRLDWPMRTSRYSGYNRISAISSLLDHNPRSGTLDYACGAGSYNGHTGTDIFPWPFPWTAMDSNWAEVVAAAPGIILLKQDGNFDRECDGSGSGWNAIYIQHADGSIAWYGHLKSGSLTSKLAGDAVTTGELLGIAGSSGNSTGPHLHFEIHEADGSLIDPYVGTCNDLNFESWWSRQEPHHHSVLNAVMFHDAVPEMASCATGETENAHFRNRFFPGDEVFMGIYLRDPRSSQKLNIRIRRPDGSLFKNWDRTISSTASSGFEMVSIRLSRRPDFGTWTAEVTYQDQTITKTFELCASEENCDCSQPDNLHQNALEFSSLGLYWSGPENAEEYQLRVDVEDRPTRSYFSSATNFDLTELPSSSEVVWQVRARCGYLTSSWSTMLSSRTPMPVILSDSVITESFPTRMAGGWQWKGEGNYRLTLYDLSGQRIGQIQGEKLEAPFGLPAGLYLLERISPDGERRFARVSW